MKKATTVILFLLTIGLLVPRTVSAKRRVPQAKTTGSTVSSNITKGVTVAGSVRADKNAATITFSKLSIAKSVEYTLAYDTNGITQVAASTIDPTSSTDPTTRELIFGTCSGSVCRYDTNIKNSKLTVTTHLKTGKKVIKSFKIKL